jgi:ABC-type multidrug transport system fused ATPase/permease subunit
MNLRQLPHPDPGVPDTRSGFRFLLWLESQQIGGQVRAAAWGTLQMASIAAFPAAVGMGVQAVTDRSGTRLALAGVLLAVLGGLMTLGDVMLHRTAVTNWITAAARVQQLLARKTAELGSVLTRRVAAGEVVAVSTTDVEKIGWFVEALARFGSALVSCLAVIIALLVFQPVLGIAAAIGVPVLAASVLPLLPRATRRADVQRAKAGRATQLASDTVAGLRVLRGIGGEELFLERYRRASQEVRKAAVRNERMWALIAAVQVALPGLFLVGVVWFGVRLAMSGRISVGELVTCYGAVTFLLMPLRNFEETAMAWSFSRPSARRAAQVLGLRRSALAADPGQASEPAEAALGRDAAAHGGGAPAGASAGEVRDPVSGLVAPAGALTAVVCGDPDAAGRLADRLGGHSPSAGPDDADLPSATVGGVPLDGVPLAAARAAVLVQDKDPVLLSGTLRELLDVPSSGRISDDQALEAACCADVLDSLAQASVAGDGDPMGAVITERGRSLSGGQRQRLALARSLVTDPPVLVLDEPTSAVDSHTEARIAERLRAVRAGRTTVVFTSSPLLLDRADRVVYLHDGRVSATGTHRELLRTSSEYRAVVTRETDEERTATPPAGEPDAGALADRAGGHVPAGRDDHDERYGREDRDGRHGADSPQDLMEETA